MPTTAPLPRILIVSSDSTLLERVRDAIARTRVEEGMPDDIDIDINILRVADVSRAFDHARHIDDGLVVLDLRRHTIETAQHAVARLRRATPQTHLLAVLADVDPELAVELLGDGADDVVRIRETTAPELLQRLSRAAARHRPEVIAVPEAAASTTAASGRLSRSVGRTPPVERDASSFDHLADRYADLLDRKAEERALVVGQRASSLSREVARAVRGLRGGQRDGIELHLAGVRRAVGDVPPGRHVPSWPRPTPCSPR